MNILFLSNNFYPDVGGIEVNSEILATNFIKKGHNVHLLTRTKKITDKTFSFPVIRDPDPLTLLNEHKWADIVFENNPCLRLSWLNSLFRKPNVVAIRTWIRRSDGTISWRDKLKQWWVKKATKVITISTSIKNSINAESIVIGNPYRANLFKRINCEIASPYSFVYLGRLVSDKGVEIAIQAFGQYIRMLESINAEDIKKPFLTIIGDGPERKNLEGMVKNSLISEQVFFKGTLDGKELVSCLNEHRYLLVPSIWEEPFGNVVLEGMACGCIPIVSDGGGLPDAVGNAGLIFQRGNADSLMECMRLLTFNQKYEKSLRDLSEKHLSNHLPEVISQKYLNVMYEAISK